LGYISGCHSSISTEQYLANQHCSWNSLPAELRTSDVGLDMFTRKLKTFLYNV